MPNYQLNVTLRMTDRTSSKGKAIVRDMTTIKKMLADNEHLARRKILDEYLKYGYQIVKITSSTNEEEF